MGSTQSSELYLLGQTSNRISTCRILQIHVHRNTPTNACRAELGRYPLIINIQKRTLNFFNHLKSSPRDTLHSKALQTQEPSTEKSPLCQLVLRLTAPSQTHSDQPHNNTALQTVIRVKQIIAQCKESYLDHWEETTKIQSRLECYLALKRDCELAEYLFTVRDRKQRQILTNYRLSDHKLAIETGRHKTLNFFNHLKSVRRDTLHSKALQTQEPSPEKSPLCQLVLRLTAPSQTHSDQPHNNTALQTVIRVKQIIAQCKESYLDHWEETTKIQSRLECYLALKRDCELAEYLFTVRDRKQRQILTNYRLSDHKLAIETGRHKTSWQPKENRKCGHCSR
ncbi:uncharacterized protein LOC127376873 [Dicentrarchus labrax]|uniref:uncharacterized protein LOC127376873 n=1 Tax=Dicentrarchus labrax TaxID=13489 RepID=UPI0021F5693C|nr:uncharacterized protein LOC127376873 [Dicentrarchus labrax]